MCNITAKQIVYPYIAALLDILFISAIALRSEPGEIYEVNPFKYYIAFPLEVFNYYLLLVVYFQSICNFTNLHYNKQRHAFYPRRGRQRSSLRHVMPLYNVHCTPTCVISPINTLLDPGIEPETPCPAVAFATTLPTRQSNLHYLLVLCVGAEV
ncbi:hypothetical protein SFRURICE_006265 [Spodoptera frugiperda]|nr:hypothetical protein SFRURICE_006265 [Spodoptera frugiperda]